MPESLSRRLQAVSEIPEQLPYPARLKLHRAWFGIVTFDNIKDNEELVKQRRTEIDCFREICCEKLPCQEILKLCSMNE